MISHWPIYTQGSSVFGQWQGRKIIISFSHQNLYFTNSTCLYLKPTRTCLTNSKLLASGSFSNWFGVLPLRSFFLFIHDPLWWWIRIKKYQYHDHKPSAMGLWLLSLFRLIWCIVLYKCVFPPVIFQTWQFTELRAAGGGGSQWEQHRWQQSWPGRDHRLRGPVLTTDNDRTCCQCLALSHDYCSALVQQFCRKQLFAAPVTIVAPWASRDQPGHKARVMDNSDPFWLRWRG